MLQMETAESLKVNDWSTKALAWRSQRSFGTHKFLQRNLNWKLLHRVDQTYCKLSWQQRLNHAYRSHSAQRNGLNLVKL